MHHVLPYALGFLLLPVALTAQPAPDSGASASSNRNEILERVLDERDSADAPSTSATDALTRLALHPLALNHASAAELSVLPQVSPLLAQRIVAYRDHNGPFSTVDHLTAVEGIGRSRVNRLRPYLTVSVSPSGSVPDSSSSTGDNAVSLGSVPSALDLEILQRGTRRLDVGRGYADDPSQTTFQGPPGRLTTRIRLEHAQHGQAALTLDKDPGEPFAWSPEAHHYGVDHVAGNVTLRDIGPVETLIVGDYSAQFGQGVTLWRGLHFGKGRDPVSPLVRSGRGLVPFQSTSEHRFFRGAGATVRVASPLSVSGFYSYRQRDATLHSDGADVEGPLPARTLSTGGLHRTPSERERRNNFGITTIGGALEYKTTALHVGVTGYRSQFDRPLRPPDQPYRRFAVSGTRASMIGAFGRTLLGNYTLFGEIARSGDGPYGGVAGAVLNREDRLQALLMGRHYPRSFTGLYNSAPGESSRTQNETGLYAGIRLQVEKKWTVAAYVDQYQFPWLRFGVPRPSRGLDTRAVVEYTPRSWLSSYVQMTAEREAEGTTVPGPGGRRLNALTTQTRQSARWHTEYTFSEAVTLRTRLELSRVTAPDTDDAYGLLLFQGVRFRPVESLQLDARLSVFDTDNYASRIYAYEHDLLYSFSVPGLHGEGQRSYVLARYEPTSSVRLEAKYGVTWYPRRRTVGSGLTEVDGNVRRALRLQVRWTL